MRQEGASAVLQPTIDTGLNPFKTLFSEHFVLVDGEQDFLFDCPFNASIRGQHHCFFGELLSPEGSLPLVWGKVRAVDVGCSSHSPVLPGLEEADSVL